MSHARRKPCLVSHPHPSPVLLASCVRPHVTYMRCVVVIIRWSASRALKTLAINFAFNGTAALIAALLVALVALALMLTWRVKHGAMLPPQAYLLVAVPPLLAYVYVLLHGQRLLPWIRRFVFLEYAGPLRARCLARAARVQIGRVNDLPASSHV